MKLELIQICETFKIYTFSSIPRNKFGNEAAIFFSPTGNICLMLELQLALSANEASIINEQNLSNIAIGCN